MHFRRRAPSENTSSTRPCKPGTAEPSSSHVPSPSFRYPRSFDEALAQSATLSPPPPPPHHTKNSSQTHQPLNRSQSSGVCMGSGKISSPKQEPRSRKIDYATIQTDATSTQPAFQSDAFAIQMPTTREPIIDPALVRATSRAQADAYQTYKQKAQRDLERDYRKDFVPGKALAYDYAFGNTVDHSRGLGLQKSPPDSPLLLSPGAFPASPPTPSQHEWAVHSRSQGPRSVSGPSRSTITRNSADLSSVQQRLGKRDDTVAGAPSSPDKIKVRVKSKKRDAEPPQRVSSSGLYNRASPQPPTDSSPTKSQFVLTAMNRDDVFRQSNSDTTGTSAGASKATPTESNGLSAKPTSQKSTPRKRTWLQPTAFRNSKPSATTPARQAAMPFDDATARGYIDPFILHATQAPTYPNTPAASRPTPPKKLVRSQSHLPPQQPVEGRKFESGFAQVTSLTALIIKICLVIYALVGLYFVLDAIREAVHAISLPFRVMSLLLNYVWMGCVWVARVVGQAWARWGFKIALQRSWKGGWW
ncbi:hypothetical protein BCR34DRAFT_258435 [Clohesyomyces aquaticus]|uniref:Uncharacterized protein n=1 Tax=Clohesyomyces aquaticus TaxID=1231657 RepID=A0A1Y1Y3R4_9PLEO|nr:hypothetical protein BCR34DRAFT_258435 [Clohesyomyces aquaticus]